MSAQRAGDAWGTLRPGLRRKVSIAKTFVDPRSDPAVAVTRDEPRAPGAPV